jgi:hypothetical protein
MDKKSNLIASYDLFNLNSCIFFTKTNTFLPAICKLHKVM